MKFFCAKNIFSSHLATMATGSANPVLYCISTLKCLYFLSTGTFDFMWTASSKFGTYRICEQRRFRRACASAQSHQNLRCSLIQAVSEEEPSDRKPDLWPLWTAGHAQLKFVMTECSKTQIRLTGPMYFFSFLARLYESAGTAIAVTTASALALQNVKVFQSLYLLNLWLDLINTCHDGRYWSKDSCCTIMISQWPCGQGDRLRNFMFKFLVTNFKVCISWCMY